MKRLLTILCAFLLIAIAFPVESEAGPLSRLRSLFSRRAPAVSSSGSCGSVAGAVVAGPQYRVECSGGVCRRVQIK